MAIIQWLQIITGDDYCQPPTVLFDLKSQRSTHLSYYYIMMQRFNALQIITGDDYWQHPTVLFDLKKAQ